MRLHLKVRTRQTAADAGATVSEVPRDCSGVLGQVGSDIPGRGAGIALAFCLCVSRLHHSRGRTPQGLLWRVAMSLAPRCFFNHAHFDPRAKGSNVSP